MTILSEWTLSLPFEGGWIQVTAKIPDMNTVSDEDAEFVDSVREQMLDRIHQMILDRHTEGDATDTATIPKRRPQHAPMPPSDTGG